MAQLYTIHHLLNIDYRLTALEAARNKVFIGDTKGQIFMYNILNPGTQNETLIQSPSTGRLGKSKFEKIKADKERSVIFAISEGLLAAFDMNDLEEVQSFNKNNNCFSINEAPGYGGEMCVVQNKKKLQIYKWNSVKTGFKSKQGGFFLEKEYAVPEAPAAMVWNKDYICLGFIKKNYMIINSESGTVINMDVNTGPTNSIPYVKAVFDDFYCLWGNILLPMEGATGNNAMRNPISFSENKHLACAGVNDQYMIIATENTLEIYGVSEGTLLQREDTPQQILFIADSDNQLIYSTTGNLYVLHQVPLSDQINRLLLECKIQDARKLLSKMLEGEVNTEIQYEQFNLDAAWCLFKQLKFLSSAESFVLTNFDPREIMCMFPEYSAKYQGERIKNISQIIQDGMSGSRENENVANLIKERHFQAKIAVVTMLAQKRKTICEPPKAGKIIGIYTFLKSSFSINKLASDSISREEIIEHVDTFLLKLLVDISLIEADNKKFTDKFAKAPYRLLSEMFEPGYKVSLNFQDCEAFLKSKGDKARIPLAMFYESSGRKEDALKIFKDQTSSDVKMREDFAKQTVRILLRVTDKQIVFKYSEWVLTSFPEIGLEIFTSSEEQHHISYDLILDFLNKYNSDQSSLVEQYLRWLVEVKQVDTERFHTKLALCYISKLFNMIPKESKEEVLPPNAQQSTFMKYQKDLMNILKNSKYYHAKTILEEIDNSWMIKAQVLLLGREKKHTEALSILVLDGIIKGKFTKAEKYCTRNGDNLLSKLLKIYIDKSLEYEKKIIPSDPNKENQNQAQKFKKCAFELLKKYSTHPDLDPTSVMEIIPDNWSLSSASENSLQLYLHVALSHSLHKSRVAKIIRHLSDMELIQTECEWTDRRKAFVRITNEKLCDMCKKKIGDRPFGVYPNGKVVHQKCMGSPNVCPVTNVNFESLV